MMAKAKKLKSSIKKMGKKVESVLKAPHHHKELKTDKDVLKDISESFTNNVNVYRGVLSQAIDKHGHDLEKVREYVKQLDGVSSEINCEPILKEIDKYNKISE